MSAVDPDEETPDECGFSYDHELRTVEWDGGYKTEECVNCGAEWTVDEEDEVVLEPVEVPEWDDGPTLSATVQQLREEERA